MYNMLFISNDKRVGGLITYLQPLLKGAIHCTSDFDQGLKDIFDKRPALVFIQRKIDNVSGDVVAQHIKGLLRDNRPRLVLLQDQNDTDPNAASTYDDMIGFLLPEPDIYKHFFTYLKKYPEIPWNDEPVEKNTAPGDIKGDGPAAPSAQAAQQKQQQRPGAAEPQSKNAQSQAKSPGGTAQFAASTPSSRPAPRPAADKRPISPPPATRSRKGLVPVLLLIAVALGAYALYSQDYLPKGAFDSVQALVSPAGEAAKGTKLPPPHLPAVVVMNPADPAYASANPGWERFGGEKADFRVFRDKGTIKVIQGISRNEGFGNEFIAAFLSDLFGSSQYSIASTSTKNGFVVERGTASSSVEIIVYRQEKTKAIKGFVISFS